MRDSRKLPIPLGAIELAVAAPVEATTGNLGYVLLTRTPDTEVVVSTTVLDGQRLLFRKDHIFYVDDAEAPTYRSRPSNMMTNLKNMMTSLKPSPRRPITSRACFRGLLDGDRDEKALPIFGAVRPDGVAGVLAPTP